MQSIAVSPKNDITFQKFDRYKPKHARLITNNRALGILFFLSKFKDHEAPTENEVVGHLGIQKEELHKSLSVLKLYGLNPPITNLSKPLKPTRKL